GPVGVVPPVGPGLSSVGEPGHLSGPDQPANELGFLYGAWNAPPAPPEAKPWMWGAVEHQTGKGTGYNTSFSSLEGFISCNPVHPDAVVFLNGRGMLDNDTLLASSIGGGYRIYTLSDLVLGVNTYYDYRDVGNSGFHQIGAGFEVLSRFFDFRGNVYA